MAVAESAMDNDVSDPSQEQALLESLWGHLQENWGNPSAHQVLLQQCSQPAQLAELARRYRVAAQDADKEQAAQKQLAAIAVVAMAQLQVKGSKKPNVRRRSHWVLIVFFVAGSIGWLLFL